MVECTSCKTQWGDEQAFCGNCGSKTQAMGQAPKLNGCLVLISVLGIAYLEIGRAHV